MAKIQVTVPESLDLTVEQMDELKERFANQLVEILPGSKVEMEARARPKAKAKAKVKREVLTL